MMMRMADRFSKAVLLITLTFLPLLPHVAFAQTPPATPASAAAPAPPPPPPPRREGSAEFAFVGTSGNSSTQTIGLGGEFIYRPAPWETKLKIAYVRNESQDTLTAQSFNLSFRAARPLRPKLSAFGQYAYQRDRFAGILNRNAVEGGLAYSWIEQAPHKLVVDAGLGYAHEDRLVGENLSTATFGTGGIYTLKLSATSEVSEDGHFVFALSDSEDWRYANILALTAKITTLFSLKVSNTIRYVNEPVEGFKTTDSITAIALVAKF
jgi:putative salt-induced outer membrane protein